METQTNDFRRYCLCITTRRTGALSLRLHAISSTDLKNSGSDCICSSVSFLQDRPFREEQSPFPIAQALFPALPYRPYGRIRR